MKDNMQHKIPRLKTVNLELRDFNHYIGKKFDIEKVDFDFDFSIDFKKSGTIQIFVHLQYSFLEKSTKKNEKYFPLYHSDHIIDFELIKMKKNKRAFDLEFVAHLLGTSILMIKGYYDNITKGYIINEVPMPVFNPTELIIVKYRELISDNVIQFS